MADRTLVGSDYTTPDLVAKVTGRARYAEDYRAEGMLFAKLLLSPMPHARVRGIDASAALAMDGVKAILTADDLPELGGRRARADQRAALPGRADPGGRRRRRGSLPPTPSSASRSISSRCRSHRSARQPAARRPERPARGQRVAVRRRAARRRGGRLACSSGPTGDFDAAREGAAADGRGARPLVVRRPRGRLPDAAARVSTRRSSSRDQPPAARVAQRDGVLAEREALPHGSTQSVVRTVGPLARWVGIDPARCRPDQRIHGRRLRQQRRRRRVDGGSCAALEEGQCAGHDARQPRGGALHRPRADGDDRARRRSGSAKDGRITALDLFIVEDNGAVRTDGRLPLGGQRRVADLAAARDALARRRRDHQYAAAIAAALARPDAGQRRSSEPVVTKAAHQRWPRSGGDPADQLARRQGELRTARRPTACGARHQRVRERGARSRRRTVRVGRRTFAPRRPPRDRKCAAWASRWGRTARARSATTG